MNIHFPDCWTRLAHGRRSFRWQDLAWLATFVAGLTWGSPFPAPAYAVDPFQQIDDDLPAPSEFRLASGAPGPRYWQQRVNYQIDVSLDENTKRIRGREKITYENHSPHTLSYLWLQLDPNAFTPDSDSNLTQTSDVQNEMSVKSLGQILAAAQFQGGMTIGTVEDVSGHLLNSTIVKGMMRVDLTQPLPPGQTFEFIVEWEFTLNDSRLVPARTGYEMFDDGNAVFCIAQWYPRLCAYTDYGGWRHKQFLGRGEFTLEFGDYDVRMTVPDDHVLDATGQLQNPGEVLSERSRERLAQAEQSATPVMIVTPEEARAAEKTRSDQTKTWHFQARNVRDFAFACSRKFIWDACAQPVGERSVLCMSLYPHEGRPLWDKYATHAVAHAIEIYSQVTGIPYPYPHATAVMGVIPGGMEYPMICFNGPRPERDGTYSKDLKQRVQSVIIHEVGHNWFPMIVNSDERHWMWLDEGLNTFVQGIAERAWQADEDLTTAEPGNVHKFSLNGSKRPIMSQPDALPNIGAAAYAKPAAGLTILRETILGRELFDFAFKEYCRRWAFKRAQPADFFRTMEDASGIDLDWFWRGWYFATEHCDFELVSVTRRVLHTGDPQDDQKRHDQLAARKPQSLVHRRDNGLPRRVERFEDLKDFYDTFNPHAVTEEKTRQHQEFLKRLKPEEQELLKTDKHLYELRVRNRGELVMPLILQLHFADGTQEIRRLPAEIWRFNPNEVVKLLVCEQPLTAVVIDPHNETGDTDLSNNRYPRIIESTDLLLKKPEEKIDNPLHKHLEKLKQESKKDSQPEPDKPQQTAR